MDQEQGDELGGARRQWRPSSVWRVIGIGVAVTAVVAGLGFVGYVALLAMALSSWGSNK